MDARQIVEMLNNAPVIAAVKDEQGLKQCLHCDAQVVFVLYGTIVTLPQIVQQIHDAGKVVMVHIDLIDGLAPREVSVEYIVSNTCADGIISTKTQLLKIARHKGLITIRRFFLLDSIALQTIEKQILSGDVDLIEILPGIIVSKIMEKITRLSKLPIIAGGLINDKEDVVRALSAGATAVSSTEPRVWYL